MVDYKENKMVTYRDLIKKFPKGTKFKEAIQEFAKKYLPCKTCSNTNPALCEVDIKGTGAHLLDTAIILRCVCGTDLMFEAGETDMPLTSRLIGKTVNPDGPQKNPVRFV